MTIISRNTWREPPIVFQILVLLLGGLVVAQFVTLLLTMVFPPAPPVQHSLNDVVAMLRGGPDGERGGGRLVRTVQSGPPDVSGGGWFTSAESSHALADLLGVDQADVRLAFYAPLPFAGATAPPQAAGQPIARAISWQVAREPLHGLPFREGAARLIPASLVIDQPPGGMPGGGSAGMGFPGGGFPAGGFPGGSAQGDGLSGRGGMRSGQRGMDGGGRIGGMSNRGSQTMRSGGSASPGDLDHQPVGPFGAGEQNRFGGGGAGGASGADGAFSGRSPLSGGIDQRVPLEGFDPRRFGTDMQPAPSVPAPVATAPATQPRAPSAAIAAERPAAPVADRPAQKQDAAPAPQQATATPAPVPAIQPRRRLAEAPPLPIVSRAPALFGLAPAPFVEGDFVAAERMADGRWAIVQPAPEGFPNAWQRRVILWFVIAFALVAPVGWLFARHIVRPLARFTDAAERLGRDPSAALVALEGPAEIGRAAHAFNVMQNRLRSFVDDRTAMVGAISHDLRTPLTRMRFRIEEVDDDAIREGMSGEVTEMEAMISSVLAFIRDASTPNVRERLDLGMLVEDVVQDAALIGGDVTVERMTMAPVEVDVLGMRRLLANLVENAVKYGDRARIRLGIDEDAAVADIMDDGPGVPDDEMERAFEPFYRASNATLSGKKGTGLGLAVCRSIARAHGGDVLLIRSAEGFAAQLRLPLAYDAARVAA